MKYRDLIFFQSTHKHLDDRVLAWSQNYETAIFSLDDEVHPETAHVWFQVRNPSVDPCLKGDDSILKVKVSEIEYDEIEDAIYDGILVILVEVCNGQVPFKNEVIFSKILPDGILSAAANTADAVFPQNIL